jgi:hypothetical protein
MLPDLLALPPFKGLFVPTSQLTFLVEKMKRQKQKQATNFSTGF